MLEIEIFFQLKFNQNSIRSNTLNTYKNTQEDSSCQARHAEEYMFYPLALESRILIYNYNNHPAEERQNNGLCSSDIELQQCVYHIYSGEAVTSITYIMFNTKGVIS